MFFANQRSSLQKLLSHVSISFLFSLYFVHSSSSSTCLFLSGPLFSHRFLHSSLLFLSRPPTVVCSRVVLPPSSSLTNFFSTWSKSVSLVSQSNPSPAKLSLKKKHQRNSVSYTSKSDSHLVFILSSFFFLLWVKQRRGNYISWCYFKTLLPYLCYCYQERR